jgi:pimeloyl-ACP methyl ester carboxylesterase
MKALQIHKIDLLGFSMGGIAAQFVYLQAPKLIRKLILAGTSTSDTPNTVMGDYNIFLGLANPISREDFEIGWSRSFFNNTPHGQAAAKASWQRIFSRTQDRAPHLSPELAKRQTQARVASRKSHLDHPYERIAEFTIPVFVANGDDDLLIPTKNNIELAELLPHAHLHIYPNSGHGFLLQYAELFAKHIHLFLDEDDGEIGGETGKAMAKLA